MTGTDLDRRVSEILYPGHVFIGYEPYSTDDGKALEALERYCANRRDQTSWRIDSRFNIEYLVTIGSKHIRARGHRLPETICRAILAAEGE